MLIYIKVPDKTDPNKTVLLSRYVIDRREAPTAVLFGCFSPFTGPHGHGRLLEFAKSFNIKKFAIAIPSKDESKNDDRNMFTQSQRLEIAKIGAKECGFDVDVFSVEATNPLGMFREISTKTTRPVLIVGPDRKDQFEKIFLTYSKENRYITNPNDINFGKGEMLAVEDRGNIDTSATNVRRSLKDNDKERFIHLTGYSSEIYKYLKNLIL